jgi:APA family basic amino acid/polyamine antiporter
MEKLMNHLPGQKNSKQVFGFWTSTSLVVGNMIGSGIFLLPSALALYGGISIIGWIFTTSGAIFLSIVFMQLSKKFPKIGGPYAFAKNAFGNLSGFIVAYSYWISIICGNAAISIALVGYLSIFFPLIGESRLVSLISSFVSLWILTIINLFGFRLSSRFQLVTAIIKVVLLVVIAFVGLFYFDYQHFVPFNLSHNNNFNAITATATLTLWAFLGLESATIPADKIKNADRVIPRVTILGTIIVAVVYILVTISIMGLIPANELANSNAPFADSIKIILGSSASYITAFIGVIACAGALNGWILLQGQIPLAASLDNLFPNKFKLVSRNGTPIWGIIISSILISFLLIMNYTEGLVEQFTFVILVATLATLLPFLFSAAAQLKFSLFVNKNKSFRGLIPITILAFLYSLWAVIGLGAKSILLGSIFISSGIPVYFFLIRRKMKV